MTNVMKELKDAISPAQLSDIVAYNIRLKTKNPNYKCGIDNGESFLIRALEIKGVEIDNYTIPTDLEYDSRFGVQHLNGTVLLNNGTWLTRDEDDGSEWWELHTVPTVEQLIS